MADDEAQVLTREDILWEAFVCYYLMGFRVLCSAAYLAQSKATRSLAERAISLLPGSFILVVRRKGQTGVEYIEERRDEVAQAQKRKRLALRENMQYEEALRSFRQTLANCDDACAKATRFFDCDLNFRALIEADLQERNGRPIPYSLLQWVRTTNAFYAKEKDALVRELMEAATDRSALFSLDIIESLLKRSALGCELLRQGYIWARICSFYYLANAGAGPGMEPGVPVPMPFIGKIGFNSDRYDPRLFYRFVSLTTGVSKTDIVELDLESLERLRSHDATRAFVKRYEAIMKEADKAGKKLEGKLEKIAQSALHREQVRALGLEFRWGWKSLCLKLVSVFVPGGTVAAAAVKAASMSHSAKTIGGSPDHILRKFSEATKKLPIATFRQRLEDEIQQRFAPVLKDSPE